MSEYIYTDLPKYVKTHTQNQFQHSVVKQGSVLLFSEDGTKLKAKLPDGSFVSVGGAEATLGVVDQNKDFQPFTFEGAEAAQQGTPISVDTYYTWDSTIESPQQPQGNTFIPRFGIVTQEEDSDSGLVQGVRYVTFEGTETTVGDSVEGAVSVYIPDMVDTYTEPEYAGSSGGSTACDYYKCASVDTSAKTWTGYKAVLMNGIYKFESVVTTGLQYTTVYPVVGNVYSADALVLVKELYNGIPTSNLLFYMPITEQLEKAPTGQSLQYDVNTITYSTVDDIPCGYFANSRIQTQETYTWNEVTLSGFIKPDANANTASSCVHIGQDSGNRMLKFGADENTWFLSTYGGNGGLDIYGEADITDRMHHIAVTLDANKYIIVYLDGTKVWEGQSTVNIPNSNIRIGNDSVAQFMYYGYIAAPRIYTRALTADEIQVLATEFTPTDR